MNETRRWFDSYIDAFNAPDWDRLMDFYHPDILFEGRTGVREGRDALVTFYKMLKGRVHERMEILSFVGTADHIMAEVRVHIEPLDDWPDFPTGALRKGQKLQSVNFMFYDMMDGRITRLRAAPFRAREAA